jgi:hypothetical protein
MEGLGMLNVNGLYELAADDGNRHTAAGGSCEWYKCRPRRKGGDDEADAADQAGTEVCEPSRQRAALRWMTRRHEVPQDLEREPEVYYWDEPPKDAQPRRVPGRVSKTLRRLGSGVLPNEEADTGDESDEGYEVE